MLKLCLFSTDLSLIMLIKRMLIKKRVYLDGRFTGLVRILSSLVGGRLEFLQVSPSCSHCGSSDADTGVVMVINL